MAYECAWLRFLFNGSNQVTSQVRSGS